MGKLRDKILPLDDSKRESLEVPEWGCTIEVRSMSGKQRARLMKQVADENGKVDIEKLYPDLVIATCYDPETGERIFEQPDRDQLAEKNSAILDKLAQTAMRLSGIQTNAVEEAAKNSKGIPNATSTTN